MADKSSNSDRDDSSLGSSLGSSYTGNSTQQGGSDDKEGSSSEGGGGRGIAKSESTAVFRLRVLVILVLMLTACVVSGAVLYITRAGEQEEFTTQFNGAAHVVQGGFMDVIDKLSVLSALGVTDDKSAEEANVRWPFRTLYNFKERAANARFASKAIGIKLCPIVTIDQREDWEAYVNGPAGSWVEDAFEYQEGFNLNRLETNQEMINRSIINPNATLDPIKYFTDDGQAHVLLKNGPYLPIWQMSPMLQKRILNENVFTRPWNDSRLALESIEAREGVLGGFLMASPGDANDPHPTTSLFSSLLSITAGQPTEYLGEPMTHFFSPIFGSDHERTDQDTIFDTNITSTSKSQVTAELVILLHWRAFFKDLLPESLPPIEVVLESMCSYHEPGQPEYYTYKLKGQDASVVGSGDHHDPKFNSYQRDAQFRSQHLDDGTSQGLNMSATAGCRYQIYIYPTQEFSETFLTSTPLAITFAIAIVFLFTIGLFLFYDRLVERRQNIVMAQAAHTTDIVSSLFPKNVRDRMLATGAEKKDGKGSIFSANKSRLKGFLDDGENQDENDSNQAPIADLFPECTVYFADIAGFTAWSSTREPEQVFILLQTVYQKFDNLAKRRRVFKVETIGDCYMAVTGLPEPMPNHAVTMVRFARDCNNEFHKVTKDLEVSLGPDTTDLAMRFGLHSGPVTAGVLRGDRARFQLFGDTVNTASRMESTGIRSQIHISATTAEHVRAAGKGSWLKKRADPVHAKGKGLMETYFVSSGQAQAKSESNSSDDRINLGDFGSEIQPGFPTVDTAKPSYKKVNQRLVDWMTDLLLDHTKKVVCMRKSSLRDSINSIDAPTYQVPEGLTCMDEFQDVVEMPRYNARLVKANAKYKSVKISPNVTENLRAYVARIASGYRDNPFHNFEHACHVTMSCAKLLKRIVAPELTAEQMQNLENEGDLGSHLHDYTHGIGSDPLLAFAITISALIHDVDHRGVSNARLIEEEPEMAEALKYKSVAEQHSLDMSWKILMEDEFMELRNCLFATQSELMRFRQLIVNVVLATDIMDKELNGLRKNRWARAFSEENKQESACDTNLRATIVIEHIIQASDVSHTMQHWHVYRKWNERLFNEVYKAYKEGRMDKDPSEGWYKGEIGFFDFYIIPLAKKLKECGVFGVSSDEYLNYATQNRNEWECKGEAIVAEMVEKVKAEYEC